MNLLLRPIWEPSAPVRRTDRFFDLELDDEELLVLLVAAEN